MMTNEDYSKLIIEIKNEFPDFEIIEKKNSTLMKVIDVALKLITFGKQKYFQTNFTTTLGNKIYVTSNWDDYLVATKLEVLRHERIHMRQSKKYGRLFFSLLYLFVPFPVGFAYFRKKFEQEAYEESLKAIYEFRGIKALESKDLKERILTHFTTAQYFWMWPWRKDLEKWYDAAVEKAKSRQS